MVLLLPPNAVDLQQLLGTVDSPTHFSFDSLCTLIQRARLVTLSRTQVVVQLTADRIQFDFAHNLFYLSSHPLQKAHATFGFRIAAPLAFRSYLPSCPLAPR